MSCPHCKARNAEGEHRCRVCGRIFAAPPPRAGGRFPVKGPLAMSPAGEMAGAAVQAPPAPPASPAAPSQGSLFPPKVVPFRGTIPDIERPARPKPRRRTVEPPPTADALPLPAQSGLEFQSAGTRGSRKSTVEPVISCSDPVATPMHRVLAAALDWSMILIACGIFFAVFAAVYYARERALPTARSGAFMYAGVTAVIVTLYSSLWFLAGGGTPGMRLVRLRTINFSGLPPDGRERGIRFFAVLLSYAAGGLGLLWALVDEESLAWHDHMSNTFPTIERR